MPSVHTGLPVTFAHSKSDSHFDGDGVAEMLKEIQLQTELKNLWASRQWEKKCHERQKTQSMTKIFKTLTSV